MRLLTLTIIAAGAFVSSASAQTATQLPASTPYSDGGLILKRRPFAPGSTFTPPPPPLPGWEQNYFYQRAEQVRYPIYSPYSMIQYDWLQKMRSPEALPAPVPPGTRPPMPPVKPPVPPTKPAGAADATPTRPTFLPPDGRE
jgi:hypothetical protein